MDSHWSERAQEVSLEKVAGLCVQVCRRGQTCSGRGTIKRPSALRFRQCIATLLKDPTAQVIFGTGTAQVGNVA